MAKIVLDVRYPIMTVKAEFVKLLVEVFAYTYATTILMANPIVPETNRFLFKDMEF